MPIVLTIAGSDPSGGAGIQADQRVIEAMGCDAVSVVTAITSQNTHGVSSVFAVPVSVLLSQIEAVLGDIRPDAVKIGLIPSAAHVRAIAAAIERFDLTNVVLDPVLAPTIGAPFLDDAGTSALVAELLPHVLLLTPNIPEAGRLSCRRIDTREDMESAGRILWEKGARSSLIKGGHLGDICEGASVSDLFTDRLSDITWITGPYLDTPHRHGSGCYLSSSIAAGIADDMDIVEAIRHARKLLADSMTRPRIVGRGRGSPCAPDVTRCREMERQYRDRMARLNGVYFVTDERAGDSTKIRASVQAALLGGIRIIQLRDKTLTTPDLTALAQQLRADTEECDALLIVNDYAGIAHEIGADGVHLGPNDISPAQARQILGPEKLIGISANCERELAAYGAGSIAAASYIGCGPVFGTQTKRDAGRPTGAAALTRMRELCGLPIIAVGGISAENIAEVCETGVAGAAVVSAISRSPDPEAAARRLVEIWNCSTI